MTDNKQRRRRRSLKFMHRLNSFTYIRSVIYAEPYRNARYSSSCVIFLKHHRLSLNNGLWHEVSLIKWDDDIAIAHIVLCSLNISMYINLCIFKQSELIECLKLESSHNKLAFMVSNDLF